MADQQLTAKIAVQGVPAYLSDLRRAEAGWKGFTGTMQRSAGGIGSLASRVTGAMTGAAGMLGALSATGGIVAFGAAAVKAAADWEQLRMTLISITGSASAAEQKLDFIRKLAIPATATTEELAQAGLEAEAFGLRLEKVLPVAAKLQAAFQMRPDALREAVRMMGRLSSGMKPEQELMAGFGISDAGLRKFGMVFGPNGQILSTAKQGLDAFEAFVNSRYGNILNLMADTTNAKLATMQDRWQEAMRRIGSVILKYFTPALERTAKALEDLAKSGALEKFTEKFIRSISYWIASIAQFVAFFLWMKAIILVVLGQVGPAIAAGIAAIGTLVAGGIASGAMARMLRELRKSIGKAGGNIMDQVPPDTNAEAGWGNLGQTNAQIAANTGATARHTAEIAKQMDYRKYALGGGELGALGVTPVEMSGIRRGRIQIQVTGGGNLQQIVEDIAAQVYVQMRRQHAGA